MSLSKRNLPTLEDVAAAAEVSTATVSRCLNEPAKVSEKTRERVMAAVDQLRYTPNFGARAIAANRTGIIGAVIPTMENSIFARGIEAFQKALVETNHTMIVASSAYDPELEAKLIRTLVGRGADGMLLIGTERDASTYAFLEERNIPFLIAWAKTPQKHRSFVGFDNRKASQELVEEAIALGHRSFAYLAGIREGNDRARDRVLGAQDAIRAAGLEPNAMPVMEMEYSIDVALSSVDRLIEAGPLPSLLICGNDVLAAGAILGLSAKGLNVPGDVSVVGFDDIDLASVVNPSLTTVHVPHGDMGRMAGEALLQLIKEPDVPQRIELVPHLVKRASLSACAVRIGHAGTG